MVVKLNSTMTRKAKNTITEDRRITVEFQDMVTMAHPKMTPMIPKMMRITMMMMMKKLVPTMMMMMTNPLKKTKRQRKNQKENKIFNSSECLIKIFNK